MNITINDINSKIYTIRNLKVMLDFDLAKIYQVETRVFNQAVKRNILRFPNDFMFQLTKDELDNWRSQIVTSNPNFTMGLRKLPYVFTEQGVSMLSAVLKSKTAIDISIQIMRTFIEMRKYSLTHNELAQKIEQLNIRVSKGEQKDNKIMDILTQIIKIQDEQMELVPSKTDGKIGFNK